jgi:hypothetical protein
VWVEGGEGGLYAVPLPPALIRRWGEGGALRGMLHVRLLSPGHSYPVIFSTVFLSFHLPPSCSKLDGGWWKIRSTCGDQQRWHLVFCYSEYGWVLHCCEEKGCMGGVGPGGGGGYRDVILHSVLRIRIHRIYMFLGLPDPDPLVRGMDPDPDLDPDPSIIMKK